MKSEKNSCLLKFYSSMILPCGGTSIERDFVEAASKLAKQSYERAKLALDYEDDIKRIERVYNDN